MPNKYEFDFKRYSVDATKAGSWYLHEREPMEITDDTPYDQLPKDYFNQLCDKIVPRLNSGHLVLIKLVRKVPSGYNEWKNSWVKEMDYLIGQFAQVHSIESSEKSFRLRPPFNMTFSYFLYPAEALREATKEEYEKYNNELAEKKKTLSVHVSQGYCSVKDGFGYQVAGFKWSNLPYCCGVSEAGGFLEDWKSREDWKSSGFDAEKIKASMVEGIREMITYMTIRKGGYGNGMLTTSFVKKSGTKEFSSKLWMEAFMEAGYKQIGEDYENHNHKGNILRSLFFQITPKGENK